MRSHFARESKSVSCSKIIRLYSPLLEEALQLLMNDGVIRSRIVDQPHTRKIAQQFRRPADMK